MEIQIIEKTADKVRVNTSLGSFDGIWCSQEPVLFKKYIVELDSDDVLTSNDVELVESTFTHIENSEKNVIVFGLVEEVKDGVMVLRLQKYIMIVEISSDLDFLKYVGCFVRVKLSEIKIYDCGIC